MNHHFSDILIGWYAKNKRDLPWRTTKDPYKIWLSEIILQQTRVAQGLPYYQKFIESYPTVQDLAAAEEQQVLRLWQGLGYYSRARNLHQCAQMIVNEYDGKFPQTSQELKHLKGIGDYTAAAIASFAFKEASPVLDGNVYRVIARYFGIFSNIADTKNKKEFYEALNQVIDTERPDLFNQAIMEFGALHCTPSKPLCMYCDLQASCFSFQRKTQDQLPVKEKKIKVRQRYFQYFVFCHEGKIFLKKRGKGDIWEGLYDFYLLEEEAFEWEKFFDAQQLSSMTVINESSTYKHILTHQRIFARFFVIKISRLDVFKGILNETYSFDKEELLNLPKPKLIDNYLNEVFFDLTF